MGVLTRSRSFTARLRWDWPSLGFGLFFFGLFDRSQGFLVDLAALITEILEGDLVYDPAPFHRDLLHIKDILAGLRDRHMHLAKGDAEGRLGSAVRIGGRIEITRAFVARLARRQPDSVLLCKGTELDMGYRAYCVRRHWR